MALLICAIAGNMMPLPDLPHMVNMTIKSCSGVIVNMSMLNLKMGEQAFIH